MSEIILNNIIPCIEDVVEPKDLRNIVFNLKINDVFDNLMFAELTVKESKSESYRNENYLICKDCFLKLIESGENDGLAENR